MSETTPEPLAYGIDTAVKASGANRTRLYDAMKTGELPYAQVGRRRLILRADLEAWLLGHVAHRAAA